jgi:pyrroline-5-carboxylate reductase
MTLAAFSRPLVMIGCGNMAGAILLRWLEAGLDPASVKVVDPGRTAPPAPGVTLLGALPNALPEGAVVVLGVKPQSLPDIAPFLAPCW